MRIAILYDLPDGGAKKTMAAIETRLQTHHSVERLDYPALTLPVPHQRLRQDLISLVTARRQAKHLGSQINQAGYDAILVGHTPHLHAPWILRYLTIPSILICQEPTRNLFEYFLRPESSWPWPNRVYEYGVRALKRRFEIRNAQYATEIVANSYYSAEVIFRNYGRTAQVLHHGYNPEEFFPEPVQKKPQVLVVGNPEPQKALPFAIEVIGHMKPTIRPELILVGPRKMDSPHLKSLADQLGVTLKIEANISVTALRRLYTQSKLTLAVAILEPFGLSVIESMACGTPVVAVKEGGFRETIEDGKSGWLLPRDAKHFAFLLETLLTDSKRLEQAGHSALKRAQNFTWDKMVAGLEGILKKMTNDD